MSLAEKHAYWALSAIGIITPRKTHNLIREVGSASKLWSMPVEQWPLDNIPQHVKKKVRKYQQEFNPIKYQKLMLDNDIQLISFVDENYPFKLMALHDPPLVIYMKGKVLPNDEDNYLAVVGSRKRKLYGKNAVDDLLSTLVQMGLVIVSGMAYGIDSDAHRCAIVNGGYTIAVLGSGIPTHNSANNSLINKIMENGAVISEYPPDFAAKKWTFPARNRIIAALSDMILVVEAGEKSGALITVDFAMQLGKDILAVPGNISSSTSVGTNRLIQNGAKLIMTSEDIAEEFPQFSVSKVKEHSLVMPQTDLEEKIYSILDFEPLPVDVIINKIGGKAAEVQSALTMMSLRGLISEFQGRLFSLKK